MGLPISKRGKIREEELQNKLSEVYWKVEIALVYINKLQRERERYMYIKLMV